MIVFSSAPCLGERLGDADDRRHALADRDVDGDEARVLVVDDRVDRDRRLAGLAVADDQLALAAADRDHRVDRLQAGLHRLGDRLALDDAGRLELGRARLGRSRCRPCRRAGWPSGSTMRPEQRLADRDLEQVAGALDGVALDDLLPVAEQHGADVVGLEVQREAGHAVRQLEHLEATCSSRGRGRGRCRRRPTARCRPRSARPRRRRGPRCGS